MKHNEPTWLMPVTIQIAYGEVEVIAGPPEALECLLSRWPADSGMYFEMAKRKCERFAKRTVTSQEARDAFIAAAIEAFVLVP
ncbi:MAG: DUF982 domain-containing protein [Proteobacteria bacterium]|uniref:DUF982 domain-containing protein n=1 Tax=Rhizobium sp. CFBP 13726 TaxID=2775296 RepID=UPI000DE54BCB|nr:DUF982 domain-containing protein [Rhizobium sp. CFBP 13726]MBD8653839.1 DUF982 domain-containing protein [Rhizobium sp. CFBP 13726]RYZ90353.1 MAG: DUF982 domain-containing protein [Pseudomonadota bacterium]